MTKENLTMGDSAVKKEDLMGKDVKIKYGLAVVLTENSDVIVKFLEGENKEVRLQDALGILELAKFQILGAAQQPKAKEA